jgi:hypothetical protein
MKPNVMGPGVRAAAAASGGLLIASTFLPWGDAEGGSMSGWELSSAVSVLAVLAGLAVVVAAATGGRIGLFRPDVSLNGAADLLGIASTVVIACLLFDLPAGVDAGWGLVLALAGAIAVMSSCGDYRLLRGAPAFPRLGSGGGRSRT